MWIFVWSARNISTMRNFVKIRPILELLHAKILRTGRLDEANDICDSWLWTCLIITVVCDAAVKDALRIVSLAGPVPPSLALSHSATTINSLQIRKSLNFLLPTSSSQTWMGWRNKTRCNHAVNLTSFFSVRPDLQVCQPNAEGSAASPASCVLQRTILRIAD